MPSGKQVWRSASEGLLLVSENLQCESRIQFRIVDPPPSQLPVLVMLDQVMVGVAWESKRIEPESVHRGKLQ